MRSLAELGIGLSVVFCIFVLALFAELCYIFYWKKSTSTKSSSADCIKSATQIKAGKKLYRSSAEFVREASLVGSFGGYPTSTSIEVGSGSDYADQTPPHLLFPIEEETKEDMELAAGLGGTTKPSSRLRNRTPSDALTIPFTSGSTSPAASVDTSFTSPPSSPLAAKLSPYAARAVRQMSCAPRLSSSPMGAEMYALPGTAGWPLAQAANKRAEGTPLRLLFERSPLLGPGVHMPGSPFQPASSTAAHVQGSGSSKASSPPPPDLYLSLASLFGQSPTTAACSQPQSHDASKQSSSSH
ncbi:hypothetical protein GOP47_0023078 [Adiantum capillus-veneris]|uniref:Uncharacterized protein n=1 Tax=Adiantum capillus-veneris TaxID=13818 RepID=A0A9D4U6M4_ADICA|nr:hypothetical protein GOP47_0023078 [Adiantum capillus-veneris]